MYGNPSPTVPESIARLQQLVENLPAGLREISDAEDYRTRGLGDVGEAIEILNMALA